MFNALPNNLLSLLFGYIDLKDYSNLVLCCKRFKELLQENTRFWSRECIGRYLSFEIELYSKIYQCDDYKGYIKNKNYSLPKKFWKQYFVQGEQQKHEMTLTLMQIGSKEQSETFTHYFFQTLKEPCLPAPKLKRETVIRNTQTVFQNKLSEVLYEDNNLSGPKKFKWSGDITGLIDSLENIQDRLFQDALVYDKKELIKARWYILEKEHNSLDETVCFEDKFEKNEDELDSPYLPSLKRLSNASTEDASLFNRTNVHSYLINLYECLHNTIKFFCNLIFEYLSALDNGYDLLAEYAARWRTYTCSMLELEKTFETFTNLMNKTYETIFEGYPSFPKFSIWRFMTRIWMKEIYEKPELNQNLKASFLKVLACHREKNVKKTFGQNSLNLNFDYSEVTDLPKSLYVGLQTKDKECFLGDNQGSFLQVEMVHEYFSERNEAEIEILSDFLKSILDISLNEVSVHYIDCDELPINSPYCEIENAFLAQSRAFYYEYQSLFVNCPQYFCEFLRLDGCLFSDILVKRTQIRLGAIQVEEGRNFIKTLAKKELQVLNLEEPVQVFYNFSNQVMVFRNTYQLYPFLIRQGDELEDLAGEAIKEAVYEAINQERFNNFNNFCCEPTIHEIESFGEFRAEDAYNLNNNMHDLEIADKAAIAIEAKFKNVLNEFTYLGKTIKDIQRQKENGQYVKQDNIDKNIPFEMGDVDCLFYDLDKEINLVLLEKLYEDYLGYAKQQPKESMDNENVWDANNNPGMEMDGNLELNFGGPLDDVELFNLDILPLRRRGGDIF